MSAFGGPGGGIQQQDKGSHGPLTQQCPPAPASVTNQALLVLDPGVGASLGPDCARELAIVQLAFARDVSRLAAEAYGRVLDLFERDRAQAIR